MSLNIYLSASDWSLYRGQSNCRRKQRIYEQVGERKTAQYFCHVDKRQTHYGQFRKRRYTEAWGFFFSVYFSPGHLEKKVLTCSHHCICITTQCLMLGTLSWTLPTAQDFMGVLWTRQVVSWLYFLWNAFILIHVVLQEKGHCPLLLISLIPKGICRV